MKKNILIFMIQFIIISLNAEKISIYHTSDVHGMYNSRQAKWDKENSTRTIGGFPALISLIQKDPNPSILLDSGDMFQGTPEGNITKGIASIDFMNMAGYSAALVGNHDYDYGESALKEMTEKAKFPFLGANVYVKEKDSENEKNPDYLKPYTLIQKGKRKIAILGIAGQHTKTSTLPKNVSHLKFRDEAAETKKWIEEIKKHNPDTIIILAHIGISPDLSQKIVDVSTYTFSKIRNTTIDIARAADGYAAVIFGGHNHTGLMKGWKDPDTSTLICESYWGLTHVTKAVIDFDDKTGKLKSAECELVPLWTDETSEDKKALDKWKEIYENVSKEMDKIIGNAVKSLTFESSTLDNEIGNMVTDIIRWKANTEIAFQNAGGVRNVLNKGDIKLRDIYQIMPFENTIVKLKMKGKYIYELMNDNIRKDRTAMYISGIKVKYRINQDKAQIVEITKDEIPLDPEKEYTVATNNYLTSGGSGGRAFKNASEMQDTYISVKDAIIEWITHKKEIDGWESGRFVKVE